MNYTLGFSPCPNDTFIFDALVNKKIDTEGLDFTISLADVETLNQWALENKLDFSKISYGVWPQLLKNYTLLNSGGALGSGVGPLLIRRKDKEIEDINNCTIAIPGKNTTANLLFSMAYPNAQKKVFTLFSEIENMVKKGDVDAGVIIHENRFTYQEKGLVQIIDLGNFWEEKLQLPIPLGGIVANKNIELSTIQKVDELIQKSIAYAFENYPNLSNFVTDNAQEMSEDIIRKHIDLYVNYYSINLGITGNKAVEKLVDIYNQINGALTQ